MNTFGHNFRFTSFGESHGLAIGGVIDGVPAGIHIDFNLIREELARRAGKGSIGVSPRSLREPDEVEWLSGVIEEPNPNPNPSGWSDAPRCSGRSDCQVKAILHLKGRELVTLGTPIAFIIRNKDARPEDYEWLKNTYRVGHADRTYEQKYGIRDWRGGGRASARETTGRVVAGCIAKQMLRLKGINIHARLVQVGAETDPKKFDEMIAAVHAEGDSIGGIVECVIDGLHAGIGEPIFHKLQAELAFAVMSINACKGFEYGTGFGGVTHKGSEINHISGGIAGGISDGSPVTFRCVFKPTASTPKAGVKGRHDACVAVRAVPVVEAMTALSLVQLF
ncbi:MAG: chorismate synthase [Paludibacteraceae bacterium]|nr:chorismate synthase [Paludibacteraceae bacterium]